METHTMINKKQKINSLRKQCKSARYLGVPNCISPGGFDKITSTQNRGIHNTVVQVVNTPHRICRCRVIYFTVMLIRIFWIRNFLGSATYGDTGNAMVRVRLS